MTFPSDFTSPDKKAVIATVAAKVIAALAPGARTVVQAGGCVGLWPLALARHFRRVITFEPVPENFGYLHQNTQDVPNILAHNCGLGAERRHVGMSRPHAKAGSWRVDGEGDITITTVDHAFDFITNLDALVLDVEGSEFAVLRGAEQTIAANQPLLWFEYLHDTDLIDGFLADHGYHPPIRGIGHDCYSISSKERYG